MKDKNTWLYDSDPKFHALSLPDSAVKGAQQTTPCSGCSNKGFPKQNNNCTLVSKGTAKELHCVYAGSYIWGGLFVMICPVSSDQSFPDSRSSMFPRRVLPQNFLFHSPIFSRLNFCSTCLQPLPLTKPAHPVLPTTLPPPSLTSVFPTHNTRITSPMTSWSSKQACGVRLCGAASGLKARITRVSQHHCVKHLMH